MYHLTPPPGEPLAPLQLGISAGAPVTVAQGPEIAPWGRRLAAYAVDAIVYFTILFVLACFGHTWSGLPAMYIDSLIFVTYMTLAQICTHNTIGKYVVGIQVVNEYAPDRVPPLGRILLRETVGRLLGWIGYLLHIRDPKRQGWNDLMADTIVVNRPVHTAMRASLIAAVVVSFLGAFVLLTYATMERQRKAAAVARMIAAESIEADRLQREVDRLSMRPGSLAETQQNSRNILPLLDRYETDVRRIQSLSDTLLQQKLLLPGGQAKLLAIRPLYATMLEIAGVERERANLLLSFGPRDPQQKLLAQIRPLNIKLGQLRMTLLRENWALTAGLRGRKPN